MYFYGIHAVEAIINQRPEDILQLFVLDIHIKQNTQKDNKRIQKIISQANDFGIKTQATKKDKLDILAKSHQHQGIVLQARPVHIYHENDLASLFEAQKNQTDQALFLVLDQITDPHNLGACMRTAVAMNATAVIISKDRSCSLTPTAVKIAAGATEAIAFVQVTNLVRSLKMLQDLGVCVLGTMLDKEAKPLHEMDCTSHVAIVMGAEDTGLRQLTQKTCDGLCFLPMYGDIQSLNVSVATGMALYEVRRQRIHS